MFAKVNFSVTAGLYTEFLNCILEKDYLLFKIKNTPLGFEAVCYAENYREICALARRFQCRVRIINKEGVYFALRKYRNRKGLAVGFFLFCILTYLFSNIIWDVKINTEDIRLKNEIISQLYRLDISAGSFYNSEKIQQARDNMLNINNNIRYISLNFYKGLLNCEIYPVKRKADYISDLSQNDIYASMDGIITELRVYSGYTQVELGQSVSQGDLLVSHITYDIFGNSYTGHTRAYIEALCNKRYSVYIPFRKDIKILTGITEKTVYLELAGRKICIDKPDMSEWQDSTDKTEIEYCTIMGFHIPMTVRTVYHYQLADVIIENNTLTARNIALLQLQHIIENDDFLKKEIDRCYDYVIDEKGMRINCIITGNYLIS